MPYLTAERRAEIERDIDAAKDVAINGPGELNYFITRLCLTYIPEQHDGPARYADYNDIIGALECAKLEFYRRAVAVYEDQKRVENGDVFV